jgi:hypothetical protein
MLTSSSSHSSTVSTRPIFSITNPEKSRELDTLTEWVRVKIPEIFKNIISPQMGTLLGLLPAFESLVSRNHRILSHEIYYFLVSRGYTVSQYTEREKQDYKECIAEFIRKWKARWDKIDAEVFVETEIVGWASRWNVTYKFYQTISENSWKRYIDKLPELYSMIKSEFTGKCNERISAKFPGNVQLYKEKCDNLVIYCWKEAYLPKIQSIVEEWIRKYTIPTNNRPFYRSSFWEDKPPAPGEDKTSFSDLCAIQAIKFAKWYNHLSTRDYNILALGQACMYASNDPKTLWAMTKR